MQINVTTGNISYVNFKKIYYVIPAILIAISFVVAFNILLKRLHFDDVRQNVQFGINQESISDLVEWSGLDQSTVLATLKHQVGISSILASEETIQSFELDSKLTVLPGFQIINMLRVGQLYRTVLSRLRAKTRIKPNATYIIVDEVKVYKRVINYLKLMLPYDSVKEHSGRIIEVNATIDRVRMIPIGFDDDGLNSYRAYDFNIIPQLQYFDKISKSKLEYTFAELEKLQGVSSIAFTDDFNYGNSDTIDQLQGLIQKSDYRLIYPEFSESKGLHAIGRQMSSKVVRTHVIFDEEVGSFKNVFNRYLRALKERSLQLLILSPVKNYDDENLYDQNILFLRKVIETFIRSGGQNIDYFPVLTPIKVSFVELVALAVGILSLGFMLLIRVHRLYETKQLVILSISIFVLGTIVLLIPTLTVPVLGLIIATVGPLFGLVYFFPEVKMSYKNVMHKIMRLILYLVFVLMACFISVIYCVALYSDPTYLQNVVSFKGVKLALLLPVVLISLYYFCGPRRVNSIYYIIRRLIQSPLTFGAMIVGGFVVVVITLYLFRSGNYLQISSVETNFRIFLEDFFFVRPRLKEILIGYPALLLGFWFVDHRINRGVIWLFNSLGIIALSSVVNSFCHFHTPVLISFYRSMLGLFCGAIVTVILYYIFKGSNRLIQSLSNLVD